jgi:hypothetical protein
MRELQHGVFHGLPPGHMPPEESEDVKVLISNDPNPKFTFMGRPLNVPKDDDPGKFVSSCLANLVSMERLTQLQGLVAKGACEALPKAERFVCDLLVQLNTFQSKS